MSPRKRARRGEAHVPPAAPPEPQELPRGRTARVGMGELVAALHRRRDGRRQAALGLRAALEHLSGRVERHLARIAELRSAVEAQGGDLAALQHYDSVMARLRAELRSTERALAVAFSAAAHGDGS